MLELNRKSSQICKRECTMNFISIVIKRSMLKKSNFFVVFSFGVRVDAMLSERKTISAFQIICCGLWISGIHYPWRPERIWVLT